MTQYIRVHTYLHYHILKSDFFHEGNIDGSNSKEWLAQKQN